MKTLLFTLFRFLVLAWLGWAVVLTIYAPFNIVNALSVVIYACLYLWLRHLKVKADQRKQAQMERERQQQSRNVEKHS